MAMPQEFIERGYFNIAHSVVEEMPTNSNYDNGWKSIYLGFEGIVGDPTGQDRTMGFSFVYDPNKIQVHEVEVFNEYKDEMEHLMVENEWVIIGTTRQKRVIGYREKKA